MGTKRPAIEYLRQRLQYDPATGKLWWRPWPPHGRLWNSRYADKEALACVHHKGYLHGMMGRFNLRAHQVIWAMHYGTWADGEIDHEDHDRANNRIGNLRVTDDVGTSRNQSQHRNNTSGVTGVFLDKRTDNWVARIGNGGRLLNLGAFADFEDAVAARKQAEERLGYHPNHGAA